jgi:hypothetical protein
MTTVVAHTPNVAIEDNESGKEQVQDLSSERQVVVDVKPSRKPVKKIDHTKFISCWTGTGDVIAKAGFRYPIQENAQFKGFYFNEDMEKLGSEGPVYCTVYLGQKFGRLSVQNTIGAIVALWFHNVELSKPGRDSGGYRKAFADALCDIVSDLVSIVSRNRDIFSEGGDNENPFLAQPKRAINSRHQHNKSIDHRNPTDYPSVKAYWSALEDSVRFILTGKLEIIDLTQRYENGDRSCDFDIESIRPKQLIPEVAQKWAKIGLELYDIAWTCLNTDRGYVQNVAQNKMESQTKMRRRVYRIGTTGGSDGHYSARQTPWTSRHQHPNHWQRKV